MMFDKSSHGIFVKFTSTGGFWLTSKPGPEAAGWFQLMAGITAQRLVAPQGDLLWRLRAQAEKMMQSIPKPETQMALFKLNHYHVESHLSFSS